MAPACSRSTQSAEVFFDFFNTLLGACLLMTRLASQRPQEHLLAASSLVWSRITSETKPMPSWPTRLLSPFRGYLSFWVAGEIGDEQLGPAVETGITTAFLGFLSGGARMRVLAEMTSQHSLDW